MYYDNVGNFGICWREIIDTFTSLMKVCVFFWRLCLNKTFETAWWWPSVERDLFWLFGGMLTFFKITGGLEKKLDFAFWTSVNGTFAHLYLLLNLLICWMPVSWAKRPTQYAEEDSQTDFANCWHLGLSSENVDQSWVLAGGWSWLSFELMASSLQVALTVRVFVLHSWIPSTWC